MDGCNTMKSGAIGSNWLGGKHTGLWLKEGFENSN